MDTETRTVHPDVAAEQRYIDNAYECLQRMREVTAKTLASDAVANAAARRALQKLLLARLADLEGQAPLCFGRIDQLVGETYYIGRRHVHDAALEPVVIDWRAPVAEAFYQASPDDSWGLERRRNFLLEGRRLLDIAEEVFIERAARTSRISRRLMSAGDLLLAELAKQRTGRMRDIVATIQREQDHLIRAAPEGILIVQGAPGTGKTAVGLHRAAYLLYTLRRSLGRTGVLLVGPNPAFIRYVERVLPDLGETTVVQRAVDDLPGVRLHGVESTETFRLKGDSRMAIVLENGLKRKLRKPKEPVSVRVGLQELVVRQDTVDALMAEISGLGLPHREGRALFASRLEAFPESARTPKAGEGVALAAALRGETLERLVNRFWPFVSPTELVRDTFGNRRALKDASEGILDPWERSRVARTRAVRRSEEVWAPGDAALIDEAQMLIAGPPRTYGHVVVDEAQDLSPMQLRMIARRVPSGSLTVLGDLAQATGPWSHASWESVVQHLPIGAPTRTETLGFAYRTPAPIMAIASKLIQVIAPGTALPAAVRPGEQPRYVRASERDLVRSVITEVARCLRLPGTVGLLVAEELIGPVQAAATNSRIEFDTARSGQGRRTTILVPRDVKGLEFDHVVVAEPILLMVRGLEGLREVYVAITRATQTLTIVHTGEIPEHLTASDAGDATK